MAIYGMAIFRHVKCPRTHQCFFFFSVEGVKAFTSEMQRHYEFIWLDVLIMFKHFSDDFRWICSVVSIGFCRLMEWWSYTVSDNQ